MLFTDHTMLGTGKTLSFRCKKPDLSFNVEKGLPIILFITNLCYHLFRIQKRKKKQYLETLHNLIGFYNARQPSLEHSSEMLSLQGYRNESYIKQQ